jgi:hypothetical protein
MTALAIYLTVRVAAILWGTPPLDLRILRALEIRAPVGHSDQPLRSVDLWALVAILLLVEVATWMALSEKWRVADWVGTATFSAHFGLLALWLRYLRARYRTSVTRSTD